MKVFRRELKPGDVESALRGEAAMPADLRLEAKRLTRIQKGKDVLGLLERALELDPERPEAWALVGQASFAEGRPDEAEIFLRRAMQLAPEDPEYMVDLALVLQRLEQFEEAQTLLLAASKMQCGRAFHIRAALLEVDGATSEAQRLQ